jgi:dTDP-4-dehydrorhamnose reductase
MLGHVVQRYLEQQQYRVHVTDERFDPQSPNAFLESFRGISVDAIVNCLALRNGSPSELRSVNGVLPGLLTQAYPMALLVHPSTDGVFSGTAGPYAVTAPPDATDPYGTSKRLAERRVATSRSVILRCSVIGPELGPARSLLGWALNQTEPISGFVDQLWNGITTLSWAKLSDRALRGELASGLHQPASHPSVDKAELLSTILAVYGSANRVNRLASGRLIDRRLIPTLKVGPIEQQLVELRNWYDSAASKPPQAR